jgi:catechol 2,3-dioxygenase-like lactoylglutathione lyase family enzyme
MASGSTCSIPCSEPMAVLGLDHVNIRTTDLARTTAFFTEVLGLTVGWRPDFSFGGTWLYAGGKDVVHLVEVIRAGAASKGSSLDHFAFAIDDYDGVVARLETAGVAFRSTDVPGAPIRQIFIRDLNGVNIELNYRGPASAC